MGFVTKEYLERQSSAIWAGRFAILFPQAVKSCRARQFLSGKEEELHRDVADTLKV